MKFGFIPLDERPANTRYPVMVAAIAGAEVLLPPPAALSERRKPGDAQMLAAWLTAMAPRLDGLIVAIEQLGYGGLIASRISDEPVAVVLNRLEVLRTVRSLAPRLPIYAFNVVTRVSNANDAVEEPDYWAAYGERLYALSQLLDRHGRGEAVAEALAAAEAAIPATYRRDLLVRRLRNHTVNLAALGLLEDGTLDLLVLSSDDTSPSGLPSREKGWLASWGALLGSLGASLHKTTATPSLLMYPGADEVGSVLVARLLHERAGVRPAVTVAYAPLQGAEHVAAYEDGPIRLTVARQVAAAGAHLTEGDAPIWLGVNAPVARRAEWDAAHAAEEKTARLPALNRLADEAASRLAAGQAVAIADVAYPNGADPALMEVLSERVPLAQLTAYGAWNTAGNTIGTTLAQAFAAQLISTPAGAIAHERLLLHRLVEDWGYQHMVRADVRAWLTQHTGHHDPVTPEWAELARQRSAAELAHFLAALPGFAERYRLNQASVRFPWGRTFELDFDLEAIV
ncbi:DUF4127 family protein [Candidatus Chloroploca sp. M-50]|uniref:DUF4127 family protein n=1 Tax=Candidatus Chloroploca mongolica TaxID=2528176 RepID=A0ABS4D504_9CHLR|nr:DUF4127 family protein [Candidatus Chloroploca mongolica]MBP1464519.1 DUF4127 family protein [Candidatus Chloroploca mongolica]